MISAVLLCWKRPYHLQEIIDNLNECALVGEIIIYFNGCECVYPNSKTTLVKISSDTNYVTYGRFRAAKHASYSTVFVQDDDLLVHNINELYKVYLSGRHHLTGNPTIIANLANDSSSRHWNWWQAHNPPYVELGFGSIFPKSMIGSLEGWPGSKELLYRKADKIFTTINPWHAICAGPEDLTRLMHNGKESGKDEFALYKRQDHQRLTDEAVRMAQQWKSVCS